MSLVTKETIHKLLEKCISMTLENAQQQIAGFLPKQLTLKLEAFRQNKKELSIEEISNFLYRNGTFPRVVDVAVKGIKNGRTLIWIHPSGHTYVSDFSQTWNTPEGMGPFKSVGLMLPSAIWKRPRPLSLKDLEEAGEHW